MHTVLDFQTQRFEEEVRDADAVIDLVGGETQTRSFQVLRRGGKLISAVSRPDQHLAQSHGVEAAFFLVNVTSQYLAEIASLIDGGTLRTRVGAVLPLAERARGSFHAGRRTASPERKDGAYGRSKLRRLNLRFTGVTARGFHDRDRRGLRVPTQLDLEARARSRQPYCNPCSASRMSVLASSQSGPFFSLNVVWK